MLETKNRAHKTLTDRLDRWSRSTLAFQVEQYILGENINALEPESLTALKAYKYQAVDKSYLSYYILNPYWTWCAKFMPAWLAPNAITLLGIAAIYVNILCVELYIPDLRSPAPSWLYYSFAAGLIFYQTMDNIDGKQARKTGTSSPLGELFDHGIDSLNCCLGGIVETACMGLGPTPAGVFTTFSTCLAMYFSTWETYHTHVLYLGYVNGPTEGIVIAAAVMVITGLYGGPHLWNMTVDQLANDSGLIARLCGSLLAPFYGDWLLRDVWTMVLMLSLVIFHIPFCLWNVYRAKRRRGESFSEALLQLLPIGVLTLAVYTWTMSPYSIILDDNHLVLFALSVSFAFGRVTTAIILAHLTKQQFPFWSLPMLPLFVGSMVFGLLPHVGVLQLPPWFEHYCLLGYFVFCALYFVRYAQLVINTLCDFLGITWITVPRNAVKLS